MAYTTIKKPSDYFNTVLYTGNGSTNAITGVGFQPDWIWQKARNQTYDHRLFDAVRGTTKAIYSNTTGAEGTESGVTSFDSDGFSLGSNAGSNGNTVTYASWNWLANGAGSANTDGSISSTVSANTTSGFSIVSYTGTGANATVGHGLGVAPKMIIIKNTDISANWLVYHDSIPATNTLILNTTDASASDAAYNNTDPTSSVFSLGVTGSGNGSGNNLIAYCFADVQGYSKFGSYVGNGNADGTFVYTGFSPAFVINKRTDSIGNWNMRDIKRDINENTNNLYSNLNNAEASGQGIDFLSNGFKQRNNGGDNNGSGASYIYMAFASEPLVGDNPATAR